MKKELRTLKVTSIDVHTYKFTYDRTNEVIPVVASLLKIVIIYSVNCCFISNIALF